MNLRSLRKLDLGACLTQRPTYYAGCLHVGGGGWADDILPREALLRRFVRDVAGQPGTDFITLGDIIEGWQFGREAVLAAHADLVTEIEATRIAGVRGNHDDRWIATCGRGAGIRPASEQTAGGTPAPRGRQDACPTRLDESYLTDTVECQHGHQADPFNSGLLWGVGNAAAWIAGELQRLGWHDADQIDTWTRWLTPGWMDDTTFASVERRYRDWGRGQLDASRCFLYAQAHTHRPALVDLGDGRAILDVGSWVSHLPPTVGYVERSRVELLEVLA